ncbi:MAG: hypothetical protein F4137_15900, partial [Acidobacteria bacterium]|nr:hypothetical protein [Acidobacteriota bacterium]
MDANRPGGNAGADKLPAVLLLDDVAALLRCSTTTIKRRLRARVFPVAPLSGIDKRPRWSRAALFGVNYFCRWASTISAG